MTPGQPGKSEFVPHIINDFAETLGKLSGSQLLFDSPLRPGAVGLPRMLNDWKGRLATVLLKFGKSEGHEHVPASNSK